MLRPGAIRGQAPAVLHDVDFDILLGAAVEHGVRPALIRSLAHGAWRGVPPEVRSSLESFQRGHLVRTLAVSDELRRLAAAFARERIPFASFKGATLGVALYGDLAAREYNDIDIIVPPDRVADAERLLAGLEYRGLGGEQTFRHAFQSFQGQYAFIRPDFDANVDLHWRFSGVHLPFPLDDREIWRRLGAVSIGGQSVPTLAPPDLALLLAGHGTKEFWRSLAWVSDFAMVVALHPELDWAALHDVARRRRSGNTILLGCALVAELMDVAVPPALRDTVARNDGVQARAAALVEQLRSGAPSLPTNPDFADFDLCDRRWDRLKATARLGLLRTSGDYHAMPLPRPLWGLYYLTRPFRLTAKALGRG